MISKKYIELFKPIPPKEKEGAIIYWKVQVKVIKVCFGRFHNKFEECKECRQSFGCGHVLRKGKKVLEVILK